MILGYSVFLCFIVIIVFTIIFYADFLLIIFLYNLLVLDKF